MEAGNPIPDDRLEKRPDIAIPNVLGLVEYQIEVLVAISQLIGQGFGEFVHIWPAWSVSQRADVCDHRQIDFGERDHQETGESVEIVVLGIQR